MSDTATLHALGDRLARLHREIVVGRPHLRFELCGEGTTRADIELEDAVAAAARELLGDDVVIVGEEATSRGIRPSGTGPVRIFVDAIDGTHLFRRDGAGYACTFAVEVEGRLAAGFVYLPGEERRLFVQRGAGAPQDSGRSRDHAPAGPPTVAMRSKDRAVRRRAVLDLERHGYAVENLGSTARRFVQLALDDSVAAIVKTVGETHGLPRLWGVGAGLLMCEAAGIPLWLDPASRIVCAAGPAPAGVLQRAGIPLVRHDLDELWSRLARV